MSVNSSFEQCSEVHSSSSFGPQFIFFPASFFALMGTECVAQLLFSISKEISCFSTAVKVAAAAPLWS